MSLRGYAYILAWTSSSRRFVAADIQIGRVSSSCCPSPEDEVEPSPTCDTEIRSPEVLSMTTERLVSRRGSSKAVGSARMCVLDWGYYHIWKEKGNRHTS
jgi:hypothetical protein